MNGDDELNRILRQLDLVIASQGEIKSEQVRQGMNIEALTIQVIKQNGRVGKLESNEDARKLREARADGVTEGRDGLKRRQVAFLVTAVTIGASVIGTVASIITRLMT